MQTMKSPWRYWQALGRHRNQHAEQDTKYSTGSCNHKYIFCNANQLEAVMLNWYTVSINFHISASFLVIKGFIAVAESTTCIFI